MRGRNTLRFTSATCEQDHALHGRRAPRLLPWQRELQERCALVDTEEANRAAAQAELAEVRREVGGTRADLASLHGAPRELQRAAGGM